MWILTKIPSISPGDYHQGVPSMVGRYKLVQFGEEFPRLAREGKVFVVEDTETDPRVASVRDAYRLLQTRAAVCVPLRKAGRLVAGLAVLQTTPRKWSQNEIELVQLVASRCWESIERVHVARELKEGEQRYRFLAESIPQMVWTATPDGMLDYVNAQGTTYFGASQTTLLGAGWLEWVHPDEREITMERWKQSLDTGRPYETTFRLKRNDGTWRLHSGAGASADWFERRSDAVVRYLHGHRGPGQADARLHQQWRAFDTALSHTPDFTYTFDLSTGGSRT